MAASCQGGLSSGWSLIRVVFCQSALSSVWYFISVAFHQGALSHQSGTSSVCSLSSGCSLINVVFHHGRISPGCSLSSKWYFTRVLSLIWVLSHQGGISLGCSLIRDISVYWHTYTLSMPRLLHRATMRCSQFVASVRCLTCCWTVYRWYYHNSWWSRYLPSR